MTDLMVEVSSTVPGIDPKRDVTYSDVIRALALDVTAAETAFTRLAKSALADLLRPYGRISQPVPGLDVWVTQRTVVITLSSISPPEDKSTLPEAATLLKLVFLLEADIKAIRENKPVILLLEPIWARVQRVSENQYSFSLKQKWSVCDE